MLYDQLQENHSNMDVIGIAKNGKEGLELIAQLTPDLIFLDIEMPDMTGFEMLSKLSIINFETIFITSHTHYAIKAFRFNALDYLAKPVDKDELASALGKFSFNQRTKNHDKIQNALANIKAKHVSDQTLFLQTQTGMLRLPLKQIVKIEGDRNYSNIWLVDNTKIVSAKTLSYFEDILLDKNFLRCHRSYLVNGSFINSILKNNLIVLKNEDKVPISRRKITLVKSWLIGDLVV
jgi:two-component system LytT family response regulator|tara:strand:+ start:386 stop:1090 length:705 start_codon:yes stop_codon:yes gene_type:complete